MVTFGVPMSGAFDSTSYAKHSAREALAAISTAFLLSMALTLLYARTVTIASPMRIEPLRCFTCALMPDDTQWHVTNIMSPEIMTTLQVIRSRVFEPCLVNEDWCFLPLVVDRLVVLSSHQSSCPHVLL